MSNIYHTEPPTSGKVLIKTNFGDIDIELWAKEAPLACRNFIQLALEGYYDNTEVNRVIKGFMVQMGDPTNTGQGGTSIWDRPFKDEVHGRIKFNHRGQIAMANANRPHSNLSQFFITLDNCDWLNGKHTIFGKVTGSTIFNVLRMGEVDTDGQDKPVDSIRILAMEVLSNPFDDIVPRATQKVVEKKSEVKEDVVKAVKNTSLLSFDKGNDDEEDGEMLQVKVRSVFDSKKKKKAASTNHDSNSMPPPAPIPAVETNKKAQADEVDYDKFMRDQVLKAKGKHTEEDKLPVRAYPQRVSVEDEDEDEDGEIDAMRLKQMINETNRAPIMQQKGEEFLKLRADLLKSRRAVNVLTGKEAEDARKETAFQELVTPLEQRRLKYTKRKNQHGDRSDDTFSKLQKFTESLRAKKSIVAKDKAEEEQESYHGQVLEGKDEHESLDDWFVGKLKCKKHIDDQYRKQDDMAAGDGRRANDYVVFDPKRNKSSHPSSSRRE